VAVAVAVAVADKQPKMALPPLLLLGRHSLSKLEAFCFSFDPSYGFFKTSSLSS
jgi:hypothetical protein